MHEQDSLYRSTQQRKGKIPNYVKRDYYADSTG